MLDPNQVLELAIAEACASPNRVAVCVVTATLNGTPCKGEIIQLRDGRFRITISTAAGSSRRTVRLDLDLRQELDVLRQQAPPAPVRNAAPNDESREPSMALYLAVGTDGEWVRCRCPPPGGADSDSAAGRIFNALFPLQCP